MTKVGRTFRRTVRAGVFVVAVVALFTTVGAAALGGGGTASDLSPGVQPSTAVSPGAALGSPPTDDVRVSNDADELTVAAGDGAAAASEAVGARRANRPPNVSVIYVPREPDRGEEIAFTANASDPDGQVVAYEWSFGDGATATDAITTHTYSAAGQYTVEMTVTDDDGATTTVTRTVTVGTTNQAPTASVDYSPSPPVEDQQVQFTASASDPDGRIVDYEWTFGDGGAASGSDTTHAYADPGEYTVELTVTDDGGKTATAQRTVSVANVNQPPQASFEFSPGSPDEDQQVEFTADASDPDGRIVAYEWSFGDGTSATGPNPAHTYASPGNYTVEVTATDDDGLTTTVSEAVSVGAVNQAPNASVDYSPTRPAEDESVQFTATAGDPDGQVVTYEWSFGDGTAASGASATHTYASAGEYTVELTVTDDDGTATTVTRTVTVEDRAQSPTASVDFSPSDPDEGQQVRFTATASDPDGEVVTYEWSFGDGGAASGSSPTHTYADPGEYTVELTVTDDDGNAVTVSETVTVADVNRQPSASFEFSPGNPDEDQQVEFTADASDPDGRIVDYEWSFGDGGAAGGSDPTHTYADPGEYTVELTVTDDGGKTATAQRTVSVANVNRPPEASVEYSPSGPDEDQQVRFTASASDPDGRIVDYEWSFGDGTTASGSSPTHTYADPGEYTVELTVTDDGGKTATAQRTVSVANVNRPPEASVEFSPGNPDEDQQVEFTADASDPDGRIVDYEWSFGDGGAASGSDTTHTYADPGEYTVELTVTDDGGKTATAQRTVSVASVNELPDVTFDVDPSTPREGTSVTFEADASDPDGRVTEYDWEFDDGDAANGDRVLHSFDDPGEYDVELTVEDDEGGERTVSREVSVEASPEPRVESIDPAVEGTALEGVDFENEYEVEVDSEQPVEEVRFALDGQTEVDTYGGDGWSRSLNLGELDGDSQLEVTAVDSDGDTDTYTAHIEVTETPDWLETLKRAGDVSVDGDTVVISKRVPDPPIDAELTIPGVPVVGGTQSFEARSEMRVEYDMSEEDAVVSASGELAVQILQRSGEGAISVDGYLDAEDWDLRRGEITVRVEVDAFSQTWEFEPETGVGFVDRNLPSVGVSVTGRPTARLTAEIDDGPSGLAVTGGTLAPGVELSGSVSQSVFGGSLSVSADADVTGAIDVPEPYDPRATALIEATGTASVLGQSASVSVGPYRESIGGGVPIRSLSDPDEAEWSAWEFRTQDGNVPPATAERLAVEGPRLLWIPSDPGSTHRQALSAHALLGSEASVPVTMLPGRTMGSPDSLARLTRNDIEDRSPAVTTRETGYGLVWERQDPTDSDAAGNDIYWRVNDGTTWSDPVQVSNNTKIELKPAVATAGEGTHLAAWTVVDRTADEAAGRGPDELVNHTEIAFATAEGGTWDRPTTVTDNGVPDSEVRVAQSGDRWVLTWVRDADPGDGAAGWQVRYALVDRTGSLLGTGTVGPSGGRSPAVASAGGGDFRVAYFAPEAGSARNGTVVVGSLDGTFTRTAAYSTTRFRDLAVSNDSVAWADGLASRTALHYGRNGDATRVGSDRNVTDVTEVGLFDGAGTDVLTYRGEATGSDQKQVFYRVRSADGWRAERAIAGGNRPDLRFWGAAYAPGEEGFLSVFMGRGTGEDPQNDLFAVRHAYYPDLSVTASTDADSSTHVVGDELTVRYNVTNTGDQRVANRFTIALSADSRRVASRNVSGLAVGESATGTFTTTVGPAGSYAVRAVPAAGTTELSTENNAAVVTPFEPDVRVANATTARTGDRVRYEATLVNEGALPVESVRYAFENGNATRHTGTVDVVPGKGKRRVNGTVPVAALDPRNASRVVVDPADALAETNETNNDRAVAPLAPDLTVTTGATTYYRRGATILASVTVANEGAGATTGTVRLRHDGTDVGSATFSIPGAPGENTTVFRTVNVSTAGVDRNESLTVVLTSDVRESDTLNNAASDRVPDALDRVGSGDLPVAQRVFAAVADGDGSIDRTDVLRMVRGYVQNEAVGGVPLDRTTVLALVRYYVRES